MILHAVKSDPKLTSNEKDWKFGEQLIKVCIDTIQSGGGGSEFESKLNLLSNLGYTIPEKNCTRHEFDRLRNLIYIQMEKNLNSIFEKKLSLNGGFDAAVTIDKYSTNGCSYSIIILMYFHEGNIVSRLLAIRRMSVEHYSGDGTAELLLEILCETLGKSRAEIADINFHFVVDGVYLTKRSRKEYGAPGSSLSLSSRFHKLVQCSFTPTESWDLAHHLEHKWNLTLKSFNDIQQIIAKINQLIPNNRNCKLYTTMEQIAIADNMYSLKLKKTSDTRFIANLEGSIHTLLVDQKCYISALKKNQIEKSSIKNQNYIDMLQSLKFIVELLCLQEVCIELTSLSKLVQDFKKFPLTSLDNLIKSSDKLEEMCFCFDCEGSERLMHLKGNIHKLVQNKNVVIEIPTKGNSKQKTQRETNIQREKECRENAGLIMHQRLKKRFSTKLLDSYIQGPKFIVSDEDVADVENVLNRFSLFTKELASNLKLIPQEEMFKLKLGHKVFNMDDRECENDRESELEMVKKYFQTDDEDAEDVLLGLIDFRIFLKKNCEHNESIENMYSEYKKNCNEFSKKFCQYFENVHFRTNSEALAESVGSMIHYVYQRRRNVSDETLNRELKIKFNLPPLHKLGSFVEDVCSERLSKQNWVYSRNTKAIPVTTTIDVLRNKLEKKFLGAWE